MFSSMIKNVHYSFQSVKLKKPHTKKIKMSVTTEMAFREAKIKIFSFLLMYTFPCASNARDG